MMMMMIDLLIHWFTNWLTELLSYWGIDMFIDWVSDWLCYHRLLRHTGSKQQQLYTIQTYSEIIKHKKIKMTKSEHYSTIL